MSVGEAVSALFTTYAAKHAKPRWGDKTPMYMRHLGLLERLFPDAQYVHLIRDGRDAALAFLDMPDGVVTRTWAIHEARRLRMRVAHGGAPSRTRAARPLRRDPLRRPHLDTAGVAVDLRIC
jgi:hypothetical protein